MDWNRSETIALAAERCVSCEGIGLKNSWGGQLAPCNCVFRNIFRICLERFRQCVQREKRRSAVTGEVYGSNGVRRVVWSRKDEEYMADFCLIARRMLTPDEHRVFTAHFLLGAGNSLCCHQLKMEKGIFFHHVYRIMHKLGREFREVAPYALFPLDEYFGGTFRRTTPLINWQDRQRVPTNPITGEEIVPVRAPIQARPRRRKTDWPQAA